MAGIKNREGHMPKKIIIVGAGASGLFCASLLLQAGLEVQILESEAQPGRKLAISGGGYANFSNWFITPEKFLCEPGSGFCESALQTWNTRDFLNILREFHLEWEERAFGRLYLRDKASRLVNALRDRVINLGGRIWLEHPVYNICPAKGLVRTRGAVKKADAIILAQGSLAGGKVAGKGVLHQLAAGLGHTILPFKPALVPLLYKDSFSWKPLFATLAGIALKVKVDLKTGARVRNWEDGILFTHHGLSGPAILSASLYWSEGSSLQVNFIPGLDFEKTLDDYPKKTPRSILRSFVPRRLADILVSEPENRKNGQLSRKQRQLLGERINNFRIHDLRLASLKLAEVCSGGINLQEIVPETMQSRIHPNLYFTGEGMAVTGQLGGYNLHWAWASAACAANAIIKNRV